MTKGKKGDKGDKLRATQALADAEKVAKAQTGPGASDSETEKRQNEDSSNGGKPLKQRKMVAAKAQLDYRANPEDLRVKQTAKKRQGIAPGVKDGTYGTEGYAGMDIDQDSKGNDGDYDPNSGEEQEPQKQQSGSSQNTAESKLVPYQTQTPLKATHQR